MKENKKLFISGPITGETEYREKFDKARAFYEKFGYIVLNPARLPAGMSNADYARICMAMIDSADEVAFLPGWKDSIGAKLEHDYCYYTGKKVRLYTDDVERHEILCFKLTEAAGLATFLSNNERYEDLYWVDMYTRELIHGIPCNGDLRYEHYCHTQDHIDRLLKEYYENKERSEYGY